jgi:hypothetical protein
VRSALFVRAKVGDGLAHLEEIVLQRGLASLVLIRVVTGNEHEQQRHGPSHQCNFVVPMFFSEIEMP